MAPNRHVDRDTGMRRISATTRWLAGIGVGGIAALSVFFAGRATSGSGATVVGTPATVPATTPTTAPAGSGGVTATVPTAPRITAPPVTYAPSRHTTSRGS